MLGVQAFAANPYLPFSIDFEKSGDDRQFDIQSRVLSTPTLRFYTFNGTNVFNPQGYVSTFSFAEDWNVTNMVKITGSNYSSYIDFAVSSNTFAYPVDKWYASVLLTKPADAGTFAWAYGYISLKPSPEANANATFFYTRAINGSEYGPFTGDFTNWPFALKGDYGGYVIASVFNAHTNTPAMTAHSGLGTAATNPATAFDAAGLAAGVQANLDIHTNLPVISAHSGLGTAATNQATAFDSAGTAAGVQTNLNSHTNLPAISAHSGLGTAATNPATAFDAAGSSAGIQTNLNTHTNLPAISAHSGLGTAATNPATAFDVAGVAAVVQSNLTAHTTNTANPHVVTASQAGAVATNDGPYGLAVTNITITGGSAFSTNRTGRNIAFVIPTNATSTATNEPVSLYRYDACPSVANTIFVFATTTNITAVRSGSTFTFTIPSGTRLLSSKIRVDGGNTDSGSIYLVLGTNDMNNSSTVNNWIPVCNATRDDTYANIPVTAQTYSGDNTQIKISGLGAIGGIIYHVESRY
jgi:hypothetical protein